MLFKCMSNTGKCDHVIVFYTQATKSRAIAMLLKYFMAFSSRYTELFLRIIEYKHKYNILCIVISDDRCVNDNKRVCHKYKHYFNNILIQLRAFIEIDILFVVQLKSENTFIARYIDQM